MHVVLKVPEKVVNVILPVCKEASEVTGGREAFSVLTLCWFLCFLLHVLSKAAPLSASQAVRCEVWVSEGGGRVWKERRHKKGRESMMGQVWNLHTLLVAHTIGIFTSAWWVTLLVVERMWVPEWEGDTNIKEYVCRMNGCFSQDQPRSLVLKIPSGHVVRCKYKTLCLE